MPHLGVLPRDHLLVRAEQVVQDFQRFLEARPKLGLGQLGAEVIVRKPVKSDDAK